MRIKGVLLALVALAVALSGGVAWNVSPAQAALKQAVSTKKATRKKAVKARKARRQVKRVRKKVNFVSGRRYHAAAKKRADGQKKDVRVASLFGKSGASGMFSRKSGEIYAGGRYLGKTVVPFKRKLKPGSILVKTKERALYYVLPGGKAIKYGVGVGREGFQWSGRNRISAKKKWPEWRPPEEMKKRELVKYGRKLPDVMPGGPENPLGARALYIGSTLYRIHGTNNPRSIGKFVSSGCIRMLNDEVSALYDKVKCGAPAIVED